MIPSVPLSDPRGDLLNEWEGGALVSTLGARKESEGRHSDVASSQRAGLAQWVEAVVYLP